MNSIEVKQFLRNNLGLTVRVRTIPCKARWIEAFIRPDRTVPAQHQLVYRQAFPEQFRRACMRTVYPGSPVGEQSAGGNISGHSISMLPHEWDQATQAFLTAVRTPCIEQLAASPEIKQAA